MNSLVNDTEIGVKTCRVRTRLVLLSPLRFDDLREETVFSTDAIED